MWQSGYNKQLTYKPTDTKHQKHSKHKRKIIWFNPPFSKNVSTKIRKSFLSLFNLHFPRNLIYNGMFNRKENQSKSQLHAKHKIYHKPQHESFKQYHWDWAKLQLQKQEQLPSRSKMLDPKYHWQKIYIGTAKTDFKHWFNNHTKSFNLEHYENDIELSKEYWTIKCNHFTPKVTCRIIRKCTPFNSTKRNFMCLHEKLEIASYKGDNLLNKNSELINKCRHQNKFTLLGHDSKD